MSERRRAIATASVRVETPSLAIARAELGPSGVGRDEELASGSIRSSGRRPATAGRPAHGQSGRRSPCRRCPDHDIGERGIDAHPTVGDGLKSANELLERGILSTNPASAGIERLVQKGRVSKAGVDDGTALRCRPRDLANARCGAGETGMRRSSTATEGRKRLDQRDRLVTVPCKPDDPVALSAQIVSAMLSSTGGWSSATTQVGLSRNRAHVQVVGRKTPKLRRSS